MPERRLTKWLRFELHACDRKERCDVVSDVATASGARIMRNRAVYVNPLGLTRAHWEAYKQRMTATLTELAAASENDVQRCYPPAVVSHIPRFIASSADGGGTDRPSRAPLKFVKHAPRSRSMH